jgi:hypothetical protein
MRDLLFQRQFCGKSNALRVPVKRYKPLFGTSRLKTTIDDKRKNKKDILI